MLVQAHSPHPSHCSPLANAPAHLPSVTRPEIVLQALRGAVASQLVAADAEVVSLFHRRLEHGKAPPAGRRAGLRVRLAIRRPQCQDGAHPPDVQMPPAPMAEPWGSNAEARRLEGHGCIAYSFLSLGYPTPSLGRDAVLEQALVWLRQHDIWSRGRFGSYKVRQPPVARHALADAALLAGSHWGPRQPPPPHTHTHARARMLISPARPHPLLRSAPLCAVRGWQPGPQPHAWRGGR
jgi:hypothetical protein